MTTRADSHRERYQFVCALHNGVHARPASMLAESVAPFTSEVTIAKGIDSTPVNARSVLSIVGLDVHKGDVCVVAATGADAVQAIAAVRTCVEGRLAEGDELPAPDAARAQASVKLPITLRKQNTRHVAGRRVCGGVGAGAGVLVKGLVLPAEALDAKPGSTNEELGVVRGAAAWVREDLERRSGLAHDRMEAELLRAHAQIAGDPALLAEIEGQVRGGRTAAQALVAAAEQFVARLRTAASAYIRDRVVDVQDVCMQLLDRVTGGKLEAMNVRLERDSVVFAEMLTANQLLRMDRRFLRGLVLGGVGATSHTVILSRSLRIPTLIDVPGAASLVGAGEQVVVDGDAGFVVTGVTPGVARYYERQKRTMDRLTARLAPAALKAAVTSDGVRLEVGVNATLADEVVAAVDRGAEGVGLLRTELLFLDRQTPPTEQEQFESYDAVVRAAAGRPVIIRTFDIGGDKPATYLTMPKEDNPFLGVRGLRLYEKHPELLRTQLRAISRASAFGKVKIMAPMVATPTEAAWFREQVRDAQKDLATAGVAFDAGAPVGVMIEIPATALVMDQLCEEVDFFSIGTNDLCQYWMAVDRGNAAVAGLYNPHQPSFLRLLRTIVDGARARGKWIGVCGEMAGDRVNLPLMVGLGVDEISVSPGEVLKLKAAVQALDASACRELLAAAAACRTPAAVETLLRAGPRSSGTHESILDAELIEVGSDACSKEEAIREAIDLLFIAGRTNDAQAVEEAVWAREATYSTGLGYGFAVPHCKSDAVATPTLAVLKLRTPVEWGSMDGLPVGIVMLLAVPASESAGGGGAAHMKVFAKLARKLMHEEFRARVEGAANSEAIAACLREELGLA
ncbi:MAG: phosphoenolpyruvate--protein phosphotransferase [Planctomycetota bacterium]